MDSFVIILVQLIILLMSVIIHEFAHGWMAYQLGDPTAKYAGRLTLNPLAHLDFVGSFLVPLICFWLGGFIFGWAKPVPFNPYNLKDQRWGPALVGGAGPLANLFIAIIFGLLIRFIPQGDSLVFYNFIQIFTWIVFLNILLAVFNLIPVPPLDGSKILLAVLPERWSELRFFLERYGMFILIFVIVFAFRLILPFVNFIFKLLTGLTLF